MEPQVSQDRCGWGRWGEQRLGAGGFPLGWTDAGLRFPLSVISTHITFSLASLFKEKRICASTSGFLEKRE